MPTARALDSGLQTYNFSATLTTPAAGASDLWQMTGVSLKTVKIKYIEISGTAAAARQQGVQITRRGQPSTGGTSTAIIGRSADSTDGVVSSSVITQWSANPTTLGTSAFAWDSKTFAMVIAGSLQDRLIFNYGQFNSKPLTLNLTSECMTVFMGNVATIATDRLDCSVWWTEQ